MPPMSSAPAAGDARSVEATALGTRLFRASLGCAELIATYLGVRLGLYETLARQGPATPPQLAERAGIAPRYAREWLEQQAASGILRVEAPGRQPDARVYELPAGHADALVDPDSPHYVTPMTLLPATGIAPVLPRLLDAYRTGAGVPGELYGDFHGGQLNRPTYLHHLPGWIRTALPDLHDQLGRDGACIADIACGSGVSSVALACAYPGARVDGFDIDASAIAAANRNAAAAGVADRVRFRVDDAAGVTAGGAAAGELAGSYDLVCIFDALHDMAQPVQVLRRCRELCASSGGVLLMEPRVEERFGAPAGDLERFMYACSVLHCLPVGLAGEPSAGTGTVMRPATVRTYAAKAGFARVTVLPVEHRFHRLYRLHA
jgi:2-polyprenyl-3-methyl-5-hydroxy-6-metoxy-1,4-benzoquinol methylase